MNIVTEDTLDMVDFLCYILFLFLFIVFGVFEQSEKTREWIDKSKLPAKAVKFQVIVRERGSGRLVPFEVGL